MTVTVTVRVTVTVTVIIPFFRYITLRGVSLGIGVINRHGQSQRVIRLLIPRRQVFLCT